MFAKDNVDVWPENWAACMLFDELGTQWRVGFGGPVGLDYNVLFSRLALLGLDAVQREAMFDDIRLMEREALDLMNRET